MSRYHFTDNTPQLLDIELDRDLKKEPEVEFEIPKHILTAEEGGLNSLGQLLSHVIDARPSTVTELEQGSESE